MSLFKQPVAARWTPDGIESTGISWGDFDGIHVTKGRNAVAGRRNATPDWVLNESKLRDVILHFVESRANTRQVTYCNGTPEERLQAALKRSASKKAHKSTVLTEQCKRLVEMKNAGASRAEWRKLQQEIESMDTELLWTGQEDKLAIGVCYRYYRLGLTSAEIGAEMGLKPPHVRQVIWRLNRYAARIAAGKTLRYVEGPGLRKAVDQQRVCPVCGKTFTKKWQAAQKFCTPKCRRKNEDKKKRELRLRLRGACGDCNTKFKALNLDKLTGEQAKRDMAWIRARINAPLPQTVVAS